MRGQAKFEVAPERSIHGQILSGAVGPISRSGH
jgi:hypothetical protein